MKQKASKSRAAKKAKKKAALLAASAESLPAPVAGALDVASPASPGEWHPQSHADRGSGGETASRERVPPSDTQNIAAGSPAAEPAADAAISKSAQAELDLHSTSLAERLSREPTPQEQWEVQPRGRRAAKKAVPQVAPRTPAVLEVRICGSRRLSGPPPADAEKSQRFVSEADKLSSPGSPPPEPPPQPSPALPRVSGRWAAVVAGVPVPQAGAPSTPLRQPLPPPPPPPPMAAPVAARGGASPVSPALAAWQAAAQEPPADVSRASSYSLWGGGMSDFSRASLPLSSSRDSLSAISDVSLYGSPPVFGSQQLGTGLAASHGASNRVKPATLSPLFNGKAGPGIWSAFSLGPAASPFGGAFALGTATAAADPMPFAAQQQAMAATVGAGGGCHEPQLQLLSRLETLSIAGW